MFDVKKYVHPLAEVKFKVSEEGEEYALVNSWAAVSSIWENALENNPKAIDFAAKLIGVSETAALLLRCKQGDEAAHREVIAKLALEFENRGNALF